MLSEICDFGTQLQFPHRSLLIFTTVFIHPSHLTGLMNQTKASTPSNYSTGHLLSMQLWIPNRVNTHEHTGSIHQLQTCTCSTCLLWSQGGRGRSSRWSRWSEGIRLQAADCVLVRRASEKSFIYRPCLTFQRSHSVYNKRHALLFSNQYGGLHFKE